MPGAHRSRNRAIDERRFHRWLAARLPAGHEGLLPIGDDAAALRPPAGRVAVLSVDSLVEGTHFLPGAPPGRVGAAAAAVSLSDLAAKGARPAALLLAVVLPPGTPQRWAESVSRGAERMMERFGGRLVGGDTKPGPTRTVVSCVLGWSPARALAPRSGARPGDLLLTTGVVGRGGSAAALLEHRRRPRGRALSAMLEVTPRVAEGVALAPLAHAMLDTSDGIAEASRLLSEASRVRVEVDEARLPLAPGLAAAKVELSERRRRLFYGGDYELLLTLPADRLARAERAVRRVGGRLTVIGRVRAGRDAWLRTGGQLRPMPPAGWQPFAGPRSRAR